MPKSSKLNLSPINVSQFNVSQLEVADIPCDLRRDLHIFVNYVHSREVKRSTRTNYLSKTDGRRLAKLMTDDQALEEIEQDGYSNWMDTVDTLALQLGFVTYDTKGIYAGYTSSEPSFPDNYIELNQARYEEFLRLSLMEQERIILQTLIDNYPQSEFFYHATLGRLAGFSTWGSGTGVVPMLDFKAIRRFLFDQLAQCDSGVWYQVADLVHYLKMEAPYFLIPEKPTYKYARDKGQGRYGTFRESKNYWGHEIDIAEDAPDAFERVEGRYVERFLEAIPLLAGYIDVAYAANVDTDLYPLRNYLQAFRVHDFFLRFMQGALDVPDVTVQPNYEIQVESPIYPAGILAQLAPLTDVVREDKVTVLKLDKRKVTAALAHDPTLDVLGLLTRLSKHELPQNIRIEIEEWAGQSDNFVLYDGFGLLESSKAKQPIADPFTVETITPTLRIVRTPAQLFSQLQAAEAIPLRITHTEKTLRPLPPKAKTLFLTRIKAAKIAKAKKPKKQPLKLLRKTLVTLHVPNQRDLDALHQALVADRCPVVADRANLTLTYASQYAGQVAAVFKTLADRYTIQIDDIEGTA